MSLVYLITLQSLGNVTEFLSAAILTVQFISKGGDIATWNVTWMANMIKLHIVKDVANSMSWNGISVFIKHSCNQSTYPLQMSHLAIYH